MKEIQVSVGRTINLGNFESLRVDVSATSTLAPGDDPETMRATISDWLKDQVRKTIAEHGVRRD